MRGHEHLEMDRAIETILASGSAIEDSLFPINSVSYLPSRNSGINQDPRFRSLVVKYGRFFQQLPLQNGNAEGTVRISRGEAGLYLAELDLEAYQDTAVDQNTGPETFKLSDIPIPRAALSPNTQQIIGHGNILSACEFYSIYTIDREGSGWSIHIPKPSSAGKT